MPTYKTGVEPLHYHCFILFYLFGFGFRSYVIQAGLKLTTLLSTKIIDRHVPPHPVLLCSSLPFSSYVKLG